MSDASSVDNTRRNLLVATSVAGAAGGVAAALPFAATMLPSEKAKAMGAPVEVDIAALQPGEMTTVEWRGQPVWVVRRTPEMLEAVKASDDLVADPKSQRNPAELTPEYARNQARSIKPDVLVVVGICSHLGCSPQASFKPGPQAFDSNWKGGFYCPCHGSLFDLAGRVYKNKPAPDNLKVPPYTFLSETRILIGEDKKGA